MNPIDPKNSEVETQAAFARRLGVTAPRISAMIRSGLPHHKGKIDITEGLKWVSENVAPRRGGANPAAQSSAERVDLVEARRLKVLADTARVNLQISRESRDLVDRREVQRGLAAFGGLIRSKWINFGNRYGPQIAAAVGADPVALMAELDKAVRLQLDEVANATATLPMPDIADQSEAKSQ